MTNRTRSLSAGRPTARTGAQGKSLEDLREATARINGEIPRDLHRLVKIHAAHEGVTMTEIMIKALREYLDRHDITL